MALRAEEHQDEEALQLLEESRSLVAVIKRTHAYSVFVSQSAPTSDGLIRLHTRRIM